MIGTINASGTYDRIKILSGSQVIASSSELRLNFDFGTFLGATQGIIADLSAPATSNTGDAADDAYISIESLGDSQFGDLL